MDLRELSSKQGIGSLSTITLGGVLLALQDQAIQTAVGQFFTKQGVQDMPYLLIVGGFLWAILLVLRGPTLQIVCEPTHEPYKHEWDDAAGHHILFRIEVKNLSQFKGINRAYVRAEKIDPYTSPVIPARLMVMNDRDAKEFFIPAGGSQFVDIVQQTQGKDICLWHIVPNFPNKIDPKDYTITISAYGDNAKPKHRKFTYKKDGAVWALRPTD